MGLTSDDFKKVKAAGAKFVYRRLKREDMFYVPMCATIL